MEVMVWWVNSTRTITHPLAVHASAWDNKIYGQTEVRRPWELGYGKI